MSKQKKDKNSESEKDNFKEAALKDKAADLNSAVQTLIDKIKKNTE